jgi:hypothetical protein
VAMARLDAGCLGQCLSWVKKRSFMPRGSRQPLPRGSPYPINRHHGLLYSVGVHATARELEDGFVVLAGSTARRDGTERFPEGYRSFRDQLDSSPRGL